MTAASSSSPVLPPFGGPADQIVAVVTGILMIVGSLYFFQPAAGAGRFFSRG